MKKAQNTHIPMGWNKNLWLKVEKIIERMSRQELVIFYLSTLLGFASEKDFNGWLEFMERSSKEEIIGIYDEMVEEDAKRLIQQYGDRLKRGYSPKKKKIIPAPVFKKIKVLEEK